VTEDAEYLARALGYARDVVAGRVQACSFVKAACQRQLEDLKRFEGDKVFEFVPKHAGHICRFIENLPHVKGPKAKADENIRLEGWQAFVLTTVFGWRRKDTRGRRFRRVYIEVPRGNAMDGRNAELGYLRGKRSRVNRPGSKSAGSSAPRAALNPAYTDGVGRLFDSR
jgi:hypothetical protein